MKQTHVKYALIVTLIFISFHLCGAQSRLFNSNQLSSSLITSTIQDSKGYIWIGSEYGISRFDGTRMTEYLNAPSDEHSLLDNSVRDLFCDREGRIWIGMITGMQMYNESTDDFSSVTFEGTSYTPNVSHIFQLESGKIWVIVSRLGIFEVDCLKMTANPVTRLTDLCGIDHFSDFHEDSRQRFWIGTDNNGLFCIDKDLEKVINYRLTERETERIDKISENSNGVITISCEGRIWMFDEVRHDFVQLSQPDDIYLDTKEMISRSNGDFLIASINHGLWKIDEYNQCIRPELTEFPSELSRENSKLVSLMEDNEGNLWLGCYQRGVVIIPPIENQEFSFWNLSRIENSDNNDHGAISSVCKGKDGTIWCGTQDGSLFHLDESGKMKRRYDLHNAPSCIFEDSNGEIWIGMNGFGLHSIDKKSGKLEHIPELEHARVKTVIEGPDKTLFIGTLGTGVWKYDINSGYCTKLSSNDAENFKLLRNSYINRFLIDSKNRLWICHYLGASCFDLETERFLEISTNSILNSSVGYALVESSDGTIWIGTNNGLFSWKDTERCYRQYTVADGMSSNMVCGLAEGADGNIWCSTFRGINHLSPDGDEIVSYNTSNGTSRQEYIQGVYCSDGNVIYFGDSYGLTSFTPPINTILNDRETIITSLYVGNDKIAPKDYINEDRRIYFPHTDNSITIGVSTMAVRDAENIRFKYRLSGLDQEWHTTDYGDGRIIYNNIPSGKYTLQICSEENSATSSVYEWKLEIGKPWHRSTLAWLIYIIIISIIIILIGFNLSRKSREEANEKKLRYYVNMAHEIRSPMIMILNPIEKLLKREHDVETTNALSAVKRNSIRIIRLMNHFLDIQKLDNGKRTLNCREDDIVSVIKEVLETFAYEAEARGIIINFEHSLDKMILNVDHDLIDTIVSNLLTNGLKYTPEGGQITVRLGMSTEYGNIEISVSDTGPGINEKDLDLIFKRFYQTSNKQYTGSRGFGIGLNLCQMLAELHEGNIKAENRKDRSGSIFTLTIPTGIISNMEGNIAENSHEIKTLKITDKTEKTHKDKRTRVKNTEKILIIEDDEETRQYLKEAISGSYKVITANDGESGLQMILTDIPDLVVSDIKLPGMNGLQIVKRVKNNSNTTHIPIILLTSKASLEDKIEGLETGADAYIVKPFNINELQMTIDNLLKNRMRVKGKYSGAYQEDKIKEIEVKGNSDKLMERIMLVINENLDNPELKVEKLAEEVGLSRAQLHRRIKEITGISTGEFIRNIRLKKAADLLAENKINISQVAYMVGFSSQTHFSTAFRKFYGISPSEFINKGTNNE